MLLLQTVSIEGIPSSVSFPSALSFPLYVVFFSPVSRVLVEVFNTGNIFLLISVCMLTEL